MVRRLLVVIFVLLTLNSARDAHAEVQKLKFAFFANDTENTWVGVIKPFVEAVNRDGAGLIEIQPFLNGALSRNLPQQPQIVLDGVADMAFVIPGITPGRFADNGVMELPGIFSGIRDSSLAYLALSRSGQMRGYEKYFVIAAFGAIPSSIHVKPAISKLADVKGLKVRATNATEEKIMRALGAASVLLPTSGVAEAIARGTIDGTALQPVPLVDFSISRLTNYHYMAHMGVAPLAILMNRAKYEGLPPAARDVIDRYSGRWIVDRYVSEIGGLTGKIMRDWKADPKQKVIEPTLEETQQLQAIYKKIEDDYASENEHNASLLKAAQAEVAKVTAGN